MGVVGFVGFVDDNLVSIVSIVYSSSDDDDESFRILFCFGFRNDAHLRFGFGLTCIVFLFKCRFRFCSESSLSS